MMQITLWKRSIRLALVLDYDITFELSWSLRLDVAKAGRQPCTSQGISSIHEPVRQRIANLGEVLKTQAVENPRVVEGHRWSVLNDNV